MTTDSTKTQAVPGPAATMGRASDLALRLVLDRPWTLTPSAVSLQALTALSVFSTTLAFVIYFRLIARLGLVATTSVAYLRVPTGVLNGIAALGEAATPMAWAGLVLIVAGVAVMTLPDRNRSEPA